MDELETETTSCRNFMEKYMPVQVQRLLTQMFTYCFPDKNTQRRIKWYNEIKIPQLSAALLLDVGTSFLNEKVKELKAIVKDGVLPKLPHEMEMKSQEEMIMDIALSSKEFHAKARLLIMDMLG